MVLLDLLNLFPASHEDTGSIVDVFGHNLEHALHVVVNSLTTGYRKLAFTKLDSACDDD